MRHDHILTLSCPDRTGIVHRVSGSLFDAGCNILDAQQFGDAETGRFFLRVHFDAPHVDALDAFRSAFTVLADDFRMDWQLHDARRRARLLVLVSKQGHCLNDLLFRTHSRQLRADIVAVASNHGDFAALAGSYGVPFHHLPVDAGNRFELRPNIVGMRGFAQRQEMSAAIPHDRVHQGCCRLHDEPQLMMTPEPSWYSITETQAKTSTSGALTMIGAGSFLRSKCCTKWLLS